MKPFVVAVAVPPATVVVLVLSPATVVVDEPTVIVPVQTALTGQQAIWPA